MAQESRTRQIAEELRQQIQSGTLGPGGSAAIRARAVTQPRGQPPDGPCRAPDIGTRGLAVVRPRRGRIVRSNKRLTWHLSEFELPENTGLASSDAWETDIERQGHDPTRQDLEVETIRPPREIAARLGSKREVDLCVVRRHVRYIDGKPGIISDDFFDEAIVRGTELAAPADTTREDILKEAGYEGHLRRGRDHYSYANPHRSATPITRRRPARSPAHANRLHSRR